MFVSLFQLPEVVAHRPNPTPDPIDVITTAFADDLVRWHLHGHGRWAIEATGHVIGFGGVLPKSGFTGLNVSYHLLPDSWGRGYASEFLNAALAMAFGPLAASRVIGLVRPANPASRRVLEKAGFAFEGVVELAGAPTHQMAKHA